MGSKDVAEKGRQQRQQHVDELDVQCRKAVDFLERAVKLDDSTAVFQFNLIRAYNNLAFTLLEKGSPADAEAVYQKGLEFAEARQRENPNHAGFRRGAAALYQNLAQVQQVLGKSAAAEESTRRAAELSPAAGGQAQP